MINALTLSELFNALAVRLNGPEAAGKRHSSSTSISVTLILTTW